MSEPTLKIFLKGSAVSIAGNIILGVLNYLIRLDLSRELSPVEFGCFYGMMSLCAIILSFLDLGLVNAGTILIAEHTSQRREIFTALLKAKTVLGGISAIVLLLFRQKIAKHYLGNGEVFIVDLFAAYLFLQSICGACNSYFTGRKMYHVGNIIRCSEAFFLFILIYFLAMFFHQTGAITAYIVSLFVFFPIHLFIVMRDGKFVPGGSIPKTMYKQFFSLIGIITVISAMQAALFNMDSVMLTILAGPESTAVYNIALPIVQILLVFMVFASVFLPISVDLVKTEKYETLKKYVLWGGVITIILLPFTYCICIYAGEFIIKLLFGTKFAAQASRVLPMLMCGYVLFSYASFVTQILIAMNAVKKLLYEAVIAVIINFILNCLLIPTYDCRGAAFATFLSYLLIVCLSFIFFFMLVRKRDLTKNAC